MNKLLIKKYVIISSLVLVSSIFGVIVYIDYAFNDMFVACNKNKPMKSETFRSICLDQQAGINVENAKNALGYTDAYEPECNKQGICRIQIEGGYNMFCDSCIIEYNKENKIIISMEWLYGDQ